MKARKYPITRARLAPGAAIAIDLGGTKIASGLFTAHGNLRHKRVVELRGRSCKAVARLIAAEILRLLPLARSNRLKIKGIGISVPGIANPKTGSVWAINIPGWKNFPLRQTLEK